MTAPALAVVVLAAGMGTRMKSALPKVMHPVAGRPMVAHLLATVAALTPQKGVVVIGPDMDMVGRAVAPYPTVEQTDRLGTGHAVLQAKPLLEHFTGTVLVLYGDTPLLREETLRAIVDRRAAADAPAVVVLGFRPDEPGAYGRLVTSDAGLDAIVEAKEATPEQLAIPLCNSGVMAIDGRKLFALLDRVTNQNAKGEYYLTDLVALARADGDRCAVVEGSEEELLGVNSRLELAEAEAIAQRRLRDAAMVGGATLIDPSSVTFCYDTVLGRDVVVEPQVIFGPGVTVADNVTIRGFSHLEGCTVAAHAVIGPFARLRPGAVLQDNAHIGNFVEIKKSIICSGAKVNHLTYIGDAEVGPGANVGAGTITCNYDGYGKYTTRIGAKAFIGSNSSLVAPVTIGIGAIVGAGSVVTEDVPDDAIAVARGPQITYQGRAAAFRARREAVKSDKPLAVHPSAIKTNKE